MIPVCACPRLAFPGQLVVLFVNYIGYLILQISHHGTRPHFSRSHVDDVLRVEKGSMQLPAEYSRPKAYAGTNLFYYPSTLVWLYE